MTVTTTTRLFIYQGNGATTVFPYGFEVPDADYFSVQLQDHDTGTVLEVLAPGTYILTGVGNPAGGTVTYNPVGGPIPATKDIVGIRTMPYTQETDISNQGGFYPEAVEQQLDFIVMQIQQIAEIQTRSLTVNPGQTPPDIQLLNDKVDEASDFADAAALSAAAADTSATNASGSATLAGQYANNPEDTPIPGHPGEFSGLHFRNKCQAIYNALANTLAGWIHAATAKSPLVDNDEFGIADSAATFGLKKVTWASIKAGILTLIGAQVITPWVQYTPVITAFGTATNIIVYSRRVGGSLEIKGRFTAGTSTATIGAVQLGFNGVSGGLNVSTIFSASRVIVGPATVSVLGSSQTHVLVLGGEDNIKFGVQSSTRSGTDTVSGIALLSSGDIVFFAASVPILGWS